MRPDLSTKVRRPKTSDEFHCMLFIFSRVVVALGFSFFLLRPVHDFLTKVVYNTLTIIREDFRLAHIGVTSFWFCSTGCWRTWLESAT